MTCQEEHWKRIASPAVGDDAHGEWELSAAAHLAHNVSQSLVLLVDLLADDGGLGVGLQRALQCDVAGCSAHQPHKVVVLLGRQGVHHQVANLLRVHLKDMTLQTVRR